jgi:pimeloyl-ACP methyl ester carboxylesterase
MISRRHVFYIAGYDPIGRREQYHRFRRELGVFARTWNLKAAVSEFSEPGDGVAAAWTVWTRGRGWSVETRYELLAWDDIVRSDLHRGDRSRLTRSLATILDFVISGTAARYFRASWRNGLYFLYPYLYVLGFMLVGLAAAAGLVAPFQLDWRLELPLDAGLGALLFAALMHWQGRRRRIHHALDNWIFAFDYVRNRRDDVQQRVDGFAQRIRQAVRSAHVDEVLVVGHSLGATLAADALARALERDPKLGGQGPALRLLTVGSTIPKFALHPAAGWLRESLARVVRAPSIVWTDVQSSLDFISFACFDPVRLEPISRDRIGCGPVIRLVQLRDMFDLRSLWRRPLRTLWRYPQSLMRLHYQFVMGNKRHAAYDYFMLACGPLPFAPATSSPNGVMDFVTRDGGIRPLLRAEANGATAAPRTGTAPG